MATDGIRFLFVDGHDVQFYSSMEKLLFQLEPWAVDEAEWMIVDTEARFYHLVLVGNELGAVEHPSTEAETQRLRECLHGHVRYFWPHAIMPSDIEKLIAFVLKVEL